MFVDVIFFYHYGIAVAGRDERDADHGSIFCEIDPQHVVKHACFLDEAGQTVSFDIASS